MDNKYTDKYGMGFVENLVFIKEKGLNKFIAIQKRIYKCSQYGDTVVFTIRNVITVTDYS
jgi:hypothetical protein